MSRFARELIPCPRRWTVSTDRNAVKIAFPSGTWERGERGQAERLYARVRSPRLQLNKVRAFVAEKQLG